MNIKSIKSIAAAALCAVGLSAFAAEPEAVQLWEGGPYFATCNVGAEKPEDYGILTNFDNAAQAVTDALGEGWRLPSKEEFDKLVSDEYCTSAWDDTKKGYTFTGKTDGYTGKSIFFPAAGIDYGRGSGRQDAGEKGYCWSSTEEDATYAFYLNLPKSMKPFEYSTGRKYGLSVRAVKDPPSVTLGEVESGEPWSKITVNYTLGGTDAKTDYKVAFDITAGGQTASVTNAAGKVTDGATNTVIDTEALFGQAVTDTKAKVKVSLIAIKPKAAGVQLWAGGPFWAECNLGADTPEGYGILTNFNDAATAVTAAMGGDWRVPSDGELAMLAGKNSGNKVCSNVWTTCNNVAGRRFFGMTSGYEDKSIFLPAAGYDCGFGRESAGDEGYYWSSSERGAYRAWCLHFLEGFADVYNYDRGDGLSVRAVRGSAE